MTLPKHVIEAGQRAFAESVGNDLNAVDFAASGIGEGIAEAITAALQALWSDDMESAPRDGTKILVYGERQGWEGNPRIVCAAFESSGTGRWMIYGGGPTKHSEQWLDTIEPTHWAPMLPLPKGREEG